METLNEGTTRLEISYYAKTTIGEAEYFEDQFEYGVQQDLDTFQDYLNRLKGVCYRLPLIKLLDSFQSQAGPHQVYIE